MDTNSLMQSSVNKFLNTPKNAVEDCIRGFAMVNTHIGILEGTQVAALRTLRHKVHLIGGGGSGHEPADAGYIADNGLSAAVCGGPFSSPSSEEVLSAIEYVSKGDGVLLIIKNYTGDIINFEIAKQSAQLKNIQVESLTVRDDIAFIQDDPKRENARGLSGLVILYQIIGNAASEGLGLKELLSWGHTLVDRLFTLTVSLGPCSLPGNPPSFVISEGALELGLGMHGEKGKETLPLQHISELIDLMNIKFNVVLRSKNIVILLNNMGGCSEMEVSIILGEIVRSFSFSGHNILRVIEGRLVTSFEMHGFSLTILEDPSSEELRYLDIANPHWKSHSSLTTDITIPFLKHHVKCLDEGRVFQSTPVSRALNSVVSHIMSKRDYLDQIDRQVGDGDTGTSINRALEFIHHNQIISKLDFGQHFNASLRQIGRLLATKSAGTLGSILGAFIMSVSIELHSKECENGVAEWRKGIQKGLSTVKIVGKCELGERTVFDVLQPLCNSLNEQQWSFQRLREVVSEACESVKSVRATKGRSRYLGGREVGHPDSGCQLIRLVVEQLQSLDQEWL